MTARPPGIVITGAGIVTCLGKTRQQIWEAVRAGRNGMGPMPAMEQPLPPGKDGGQAVDLPADFEPQLPREARYLRWTIRDATDEAKTAATYAPERCGLMVGTTLHGMRAGGKFFRTGDHQELRTFLAGHTIDLATRDLPIRGLAATTCSACSSSLGSIALAITLLQTGQLDLVVAGGYDTVSEYVYAGFSSLRLVADGPLRPFSTRRQGMKLAEGYGIVVLERLHDAQRRGAKPLVMIAGWGESADAHHLTQPHPQGTGAARAMRQAVDRAGMQPGQIDLLAAHATGTPDNDAAERAALSIVFGEGLEKVPVVGFKSHVGHTLGGAGAVELILSMMALQEQTVPPCAQVEPDEIEYADLQVATGVARPAKIGATLNTSLGFGGANTSMVLVQASGQTSAPEPSSLRDVFITGVGAVLPGALSNEVLLERLSKSQEPAWARPASPITDADLELLLNARRVRRMSEYVKLQLAAATIACRTAQIEDMPAFAADCPAILGTMHGSAGYSVAYYSQIVQEGIGAANPMLFAEGVPNAGAAQLSLMLGLKGACQTIIGTRTSGLDALNLATARIASGAWDRAIVGAAEETCADIQRAYQSCGLAVTLPGSPPFGEESGFVCGGGGVAVVLESRESIDRRHGNALARVSRWASGRQTPDKASLAMANVLEALEPVRAIISSACGTWIDRAEATAIRRSGADAVVWTPYGLAQELFSAGPLLGIVAVLLSGRVPSMFQAGAKISGLRLSAGLESPGPFASIVTDFTGCVCGTRIELEL